MKSEVEASAALAFFFFFSIQGDIPIDFDRWGERPVCPRRWFGYLSRISWVQGLSPPKHRDRTNGDLPWPLGSLLFREGGWVP